MENASKALLMAGEVLIAIIVLSIMVALFSRVSEVSEALNERLDKRDIVMFNTEYSKFEANDNLSKKYITPEEVVTLINKVLDWNKSTEEPTEEIELKIYNKDQTEPLLSIKEDNLYKKDGSEANQNDLISFLKEQKKYNDVLANMDKIKNKTITDEELKKLKDTKFTCEITYNGPNGRVNNITIKIIEDI